MLVASPDETTEVYRSKAGSTAEVVAEVKITTVPEMDLIARFCCQILSVVVNLRRRNFPAKELNPPWMWKLVAEDCGFGSEP